MSSSTLALSIILVPCIVFGSIILFFPWKKTNIQKDFEEDIRMREAMNVLKISQNDGYILKRKQAEEAEKFLRTKLAWLPRNFTVPNIFLQSDKQSIFMQEGKKDNRTLVFVHHPRAAGGHVINCLNNLSYTKNMAMSPLMNSKTRLLWDAGNPDTVTFQNQISIHRGGFAFGICEKLQRNCHYFTVFRDPFETMVSLYQHCLDIGTHEYCSLLKFKFVSLREWIIENSGLLLNQFLYSSHVCLARRPDSSTETLKHPCWYRQKLENDKLTDQEKEHVANYIARNLRRWFSVIGVFDKFDESMAMFEHALGETFTKCSSNRKVSSFQEETVTTNKAHFLAREDKVSDDSEEYEDEIDMVRDDFYVQRALSPSNTIYTEAKRVFNVQRQILYNKLNNN